MWQFNVLNRGQIERNPREAEFFNVGDIDKSASLIREVIQNSLDAKCVDQDQVKVRIKLGQHHKINNDIFYKDLIPHVESCRLQHNYLSSSVINFLTIEDFNTTGLDGPIDLDESGMDGVEGNYYKFWWAEGSSFKSGKKAGRWGLGKTALNVASTLRSFWGYTVRQDDKRKLLLGKSLLKTHWYNGSKYDYYGHFSTANSQPIEDPAQLEIFNNQFDIKRNDEAGLSLVVPLPVQEMTLDTLIRSTIIYYFFPVIKKMLVVELTDGSSEIILNDHTLREVAKVQDWSDSPWKDRNVDSLMEFLEDAVTMPYTKIIPMQLPVGSPKLTTTLFGDKLDMTRDIFDKGELVYLHMPVVIQPKGTAKTISSFDIYLKRDDSLSKADEFYVRGGITIAEIKELGNRRIRGLLSAQDEPVCTFLGDCESPAHTDWKERTDQFQDKYEGAISTLRFIKTSMVKAASILDQPQPGIDRDFLQDVFNISEEIDPTGKTKQTKKSQIELPLGKATFDVNKIKGGFNIKLHDSEAELPVSGIVNVAYDIFSGNPFSNYNLMDFNLEQTPIVIRVKGGNITNPKANHVTITAETKDFELQIDGFDEHRDLIVDVEDIKS